jgi:hypothetical protein
LPVMRGAPDAVRQRKTSGMRKTFFIGHIYYSIIKGF